MVRNFTALAVIVAFVVVERRVRVGRAHAAMAKQRGMELESMKPNPQHNGH